MNFIPSPFASSNHPVDHNPDPLLFSIPVPESAPTRTKFQLNRAELNSASRRPSRRRWVYLATRAVASNIRRYGVRRHVQPISGHGLRSRCSVINI
ncbi:hypothetical protein EVAR_29577_1 [Eumeta japonica]|uniref:Uncharacterized protein n=1 Tax=Eumeta variegata TaxID=151549 RepID=A0A4C1VUB4_EUMVA|nr:hypothetical protein EVAR_29577_1 [Eumeta japonica]